MVFRMHIAGVFVAAVSAIAANIAFAADEIPTFEMPAEETEYVPVEVGGSWYLRGDVGYSIENSLRKHEAVKRYDAKVQPWMFNIGIGYHFNDVIRVDLKGGTLPTYDLKTGETKAYDAMANAYFDLGTLARFTPYLGAGIGFIYSDNDFHSASGKTIAHDLSLAYALHAGFAYKVSNNVSLDVGYEYKASPNAPDYSVDNGLTLKGRGIDFHAVKVGLRYDLW